MIKTGLVYDEKMMNHKSEGYHPENSKRISRIWEIIKEEKIDKKCKILNSRLAKMEELELVYSNKYINSVKKNSYIDKGGKL
jgi:acetoin utilization deacetylase AcuC-like enzyme